ncbi:Ureidoglycolate lyase [Pseudobythopirellula maris]|uniref:Ureidoglycolate lyase n=1 Tax=Pseudobythopirellula maris TaxID=2527991 RepID=A0A5C5ZUJ7_9BACT|nr:fumarylacetoacetate hydrolase family protein [Pseudobythopirellula maris]TWT90718.1 Ureidoglycolate lyase [Pseudobythopirellula maris]
MKIVRFLDPQGAVQYGLREPDGGVTLAEGDPYSGLRDTRQSAEVASPLPPIAPAAILCIGLNYAKHAEETGAKRPEFPVVFMKTPSAATATGAPIELPRRLRSNEVDYEAELAVVIGKPCKNASRDNALDYVLGYTCGNDVSARDWQKRGGGGQWCRGKTFDTFAPLGPWIVTTDEIPNPNNLSIASRLNGETVQDAHTSDMIFDVPTLIEFLSASVTLAPGTVILTGTPSGVGMARDPQLWLKPSDEIVVEIERIGRLSNPVVEERAEQLDHRDL